MSDSSPSSSDGETVEGMPFSKQDLNISDLIFEDSSFARGAFGRMVKADYFGVTVCVKILKKQRKKELAKFVHREMAALKTLSHPNLVQFIGVTERGNEICLVTEYISGGTLRKLLKDRSISIPWHIRIQIAVDIASAMTYLHSRKIMHRDLKSKNLLVGDNWKIKICDFGFARSVHDKKKAAALTFCGTEEYMAPEVIFGMEYDERAEVYSYGLLLCEIMVRQKVEETVPRTSHTNYGLDHQEFTAHLPRDCPIELVELMFLCTEYEPKNRPGFRDITQILREIKQTVSPMLQASPGPGRASPALTPTPAPVVPPPSHTYATSHGAPSPTQAPASAPFPTHAYATSHGAPSPTQVPAAAPFPTQAPPPAVPPAQAARSPSPVQAPAHVATPLSPALATVPPQQIPPPFSLEDDLTTPFEDVSLHSPTSAEKASQVAEKPQNGTAKPTNHTPSAVTSPPKVRPPAPFRRSPSTPIMDQQKSTGKPGAKEPPRVPGKRDPPGPSKLGKPPATAPKPPPKTSPSVKAAVEEILSKPISPLTRTSSFSNFPSPSTKTNSPSPKPAAPARAPPSKISPPVPSAKTHATSPPPSPSPSPIPPYKMVPKANPSSSSPTPPPSSSPRALPPKDRPTSPSAKPSPPTRAGRPVLPSEIVDKKRIPTS